MITASSVSKKPRAVQAAFAATERPSPVSILSLLAGCTRYLPPHLGSASPYTLAGVQGYVGEAQLEAAELRQLLDKRQGGDGPGG